MIGIPDQSGRGLYPLSLPARQTSLKKHLWCNNFASWVSLLTYGLESWRLNSPFDQAEKVSLNENRWNTHTYIYIYLYNLLCLCSHCFKQKRTRNAHYTPAHSRPKTRSWDDSPEDNKAKFPGKVLVCCAQGAWVRRRNGFHFSASVVCCCRPIGLAIAFARALDDSQSQ